MISTFKNKILTLIFCSATLFLVPQISLAQESIAFSVSPTILDMTAAPGQTWNSSIRLINPNRFGLRLFVRVTSFTPRGESGVPQFFEVNPEETKGQSLPEWINTDAEIFIEPEKIFELPLSITVPSGAAPGGHFAAIMISTSPPPGSGNATKIETAQVISALLFLKVTGDVTEQATIRSFRTTEYVLNRPSATFELRIENQGNVHIQPQGEIVITNMWGQERGVIRVNQQTLFGNVLPKQVRRFSFEWTGDWSIADIGRYTATAALAYGTEARQSISASTNFWIVPWKPILFVLTVISGFVALLSWGIRLYVRRMLQLAGVEVVDARAVHPPVTKRQLVAPLEAGLLDLRNRLKPDNPKRSKIEEIISFIGTYRLFFIIIVAVVIFVFGIVWFVKEATNPSRDLSVTYLEENKTVDSSAGEGVETAVTSPTVILINESGANQLLKQYQELVESQGFVTLAPEDVTDRESKTTRIVYPINLQTQTLILSDLLGGALLSADSNPDGKSEITIYLGSDLIPSN